MDSVFVVSTSVPVSETCFDYVSSILDEIALEGLDGITLSTLWIRLQNRPHFPIAIDSDSKLFLWEVIAVHKQVEIFELPEPRSTLVLLNRYDNTDEELGVVIEPNEIPTDIYPIHLVDDGDMKGSCGTYKTRRCITTLVRNETTLLLTLKEALDQWGEKLVLVASPKTRQMSLCGMEICALLNLPADMYCMLERIGRARYLGEVTQGEMGLLATKATFVGKIHYFCVKLIKENLITKQLHYLKNRNGQSVSGSLFHLKRFYVQRKSKMEILMHRMCDILKNKPLHREVSKSLRLELGVKENTFKKLFQKSSDVPFEVLLIPHKEMYPDATDKECFQSKGQERFVKVIQLLHSYNEEEEDEKGLLFPSSGNPSSGYSDPYKISYEKPLTFQVYELIRSAGPEGITAQEIQKIIRLPWLQVRWLCKQVEKSGIVVVMMQDRGRQRVTKYISKHFSETSECLIQAKEQQKRFLDIPFQVVLDRKKCDNPVKVKVEPDTLIPEKITNNMNINEKDQKSDFQDIVSEVIMIKKEDMPVKSLSKKSPPLGEMLGVKSKNKLDNHITYRILKRAEMILEILKSVKIALVFELKKIIIEQEMKEGYSWRMDKKSTLRLLDRLAQNELIRYVNIKLELGKVIKVLRFVCDPSVKQDDPEMKVAIEQAKFKYFGVSNKGSVPEKVPKKELMDKTVKSSPMEYEPTAGRTLYGLQPKFIRAKTLHLFLFYLTYNYDGKREIHKEPFVYHESVCWKRFVPPLPNYDKPCPGWCILADTILCMPLSIFLKIVNLRYRISGLQEYMDDDIKCNYLIKHLPQELRNSLLCGGRYKFIIHEILCRLCYMGLLSFGRQHRKDKDQVFIYIHRNASIMDTSISPPGYIFLDNSIEYAVKKYHFKVLSDLEVYWTHLGNICFHTNLGRYNAARGQNITLMNINHKEEMVKALEGIEFNQVVDDGSVPGDHLGAGGLDSALFAHLKRNWSWSNDKSQFLMKDFMRHKLEVESLSSEKYLMSYLKTRSTERVSNVGSLHRLQRFNQNTASLESAKSCPESTVSKNKRFCTGLRGPATGSGAKHVEIRTIERKETKRKPYYDDKDVAAMKKMFKQRVDWSQLEDSFLLLCKVASLFLDPKSKRLVVPFTVVRDLIHEKFPNLSCNKSSRACQRRVRYMMMNPITSCDVSVFLGEARQDTELVKEFDRPKPPKTKEDEWKTMFADVLRKLETNFTKSVSDRCKKCELPDDLNIFHNNYEIKAPANVTLRESYHQDPSEIRDIKRGIIYSLILSSLSTVGDKLNWSYTFYKLYKQYPSELLSDVIEKLCKEHLITKKREYHKKVLQSGPMTSIPFRFTYMYSNVFLTRYPVALYEQSFQFLQKLTGCDLNSSPTFDGDVCAGYCATILSLMHMDLLEFEVTNPDRITFLDTSLCEEERNKEISHCEVGKANESLSESNESHQKAVSVASGTNSTPPGSIASAEVPATKASRLALYMLRKECSQPPAERTQHSQDYFVINSSTLLCILKDLSDYHNTSFFPLNPRKVCEDNFDITCKLEPTNTLSVLKRIVDIRTINKIVSAQTLYIPSSMLSQEQDNKSLEQLYQSYSSTTLNDAQKISNCIYETKEIGISHSELWKKFLSMEGLLSFHTHISLLRKEMIIFRVGITCFRYVSAAFASKWIVSSFIIPKEMRLYVNENLKHGDFDQQLDSLVSNSSETKGQISTDEIHTAKGTPFEGIIAIVKEENNSSGGFEEHGPSTSSEQETTSNKRKYDPLDDETSAAQSRHKRHKKDYTDDISPSKEEFQKVNFISRVWRKPDGSLNRPVLAKFLTVICGHISSFPGVTDTQICERFSTAIQPVQTLEILELLEEACCINRYQTVVHHKPSLLSSPCHVFVTQKLKPENMTYFEVSIDMPMKIGKLRDKLMLKH